MTLQKENEKLLQQALDMLEEQALHIEAPMLPAGEELLNRIRAAISQQTEPVCDTCHGQGEVWTGENQSFGYMSMQPPEPIMDVCPECGGEANEILESQEVDFETFKAGLIALCEKHGVQLATSKSDSLDVWRLQSGDEILYSGLVDCTQPKGEMVAELRTDMTAKG